MSRIPLATKDDFSAEKTDLLRTLSPKEGLPSEYHHLIEDQTRNVYRSLGVNPPILERFRAFGQAVWQESGLTARDRELVILTLACHADSAYEWHQHVRVALAEGLSPEEIRYVAEGQDEAFTDAEAALMSYVRSYADGDVSDADHEDLAEHYDNSTIVGIGSLVGMYLFIALLVDALDVDVEEEFVGWDLSGL